MPRDCISGRRGGCSNVASQDVEKLGYCPQCYEYVKNTCAIPFEEFKAKRQAGAVYHVELKDVFALICARF